MTFQAKKLKKKIHDLEHACAAENQPSCNCSWESSQRWERERHPRRSSHENVANDVKEFKKSLPTDIFTENSESDSDACNNNEKLLSNQKTIPDVQVTQVQGHRKLLKLKRTAIKQEKPSFNNAYIDLDELPDLDEDVQLVYDSSVIDISDDEKPERATNFVPNFKEKIQKALKGLSINIRKLPSDVKSIKLDEPPKKRLRLSRSLSGEGRHFLDVVKGLKADSDDDIPTNSDDSDYVHSNSSEIDSSDNDSSCSSYEKHRRSKCSTQQSRTIRGKRKRLLQKEKTPQNLQEEETDSDSDSQNDAVSETPLLPVSLPLFQSKFHRLRHGEQSNRSRASSFIGDAELGLIESHSEPNDQNQLLHCGLDIMKEFITFDQKPSNEMLQTVLLHMLINSNDVRVLESTYSLLNHAQSLHQPCGNVPFTWEDVETIVDSLCSPVSASNPTLGKILALKYIVNMLNDELESHSLLSQFRILQSCAGKMLRADKMFHRVKQTIHWLSGALSLGQFDDSSGTLFGLHLSNPKTKKHGSHKPKLLPLLQQLLDMSVNTSANPENECKRCATEMVSTYIHIANFHHRKVLLSTIVSPMLKFYLTHRWVQIIIRKSVPVH